MQPSGPSTAHTSRTTLPPLPDPTPGTVATWLGELPLANVDYCLDALLTLLRALNAKPDLTSSIRLALAELIRPDIEFVTEQIDDHSIEASLPYPDDTARQLETASQLHRELGNLYAYAYPVSRSLTSLWPGNSDPCLVSIYRAFQHWGLALLGAAKLYREPDLAFWPDLYRSYRQAEAHGVMSARFRDEAEPPACHTPLGQFKRVCLFAMTDYGRYRQRDMWNIFQILGELADLADWESQPAIDDQKARFQMNLDSDAGPHRINGTAIPSPTSRFLFIGRLLERLLDKTSEQRNRLALQGISGIRLPKLLAKSLYGAAHRRSERLPMHQPCHLFIGLQELIHILCPGAPARPKANEARTPPPKHPHGPKTLAGLELIPLEGEAWGHNRQDEQVLRTNAVIERIMLDNWGCPREDIWGGQPGQGDTDGLADQGAAGELLNADPHGYCILWCDGPDHRIQAGSPIGISENQRFPHIGVIRWLAQGETGLRFGVELLSPVAEAVQVWDERGDLKGKGLLLPAIAPIRPEPEILLPPVGFQLGSALHLTGKHTQASFHLHKVREATFCFTQFTLIRDTQTLGLA